MNWQLQQLVLVLVISRLCTRAGKGHQDGQARVQVGACDFLHAI